eukprot:scaffold2821_cov240-Pinguiococcus_pyrenoidosus.AAC.5
MAQIACRQRCGGAPRLFANPGPATHVAESSASLGDRIGTIINNRGDGTVDVQWDDDFSWNTASSERRAEAELWPVVPRRRANSDCKEEVRAHMHGPLAACSFSVTARWLILRCLCRSRAESRRRARRRHVQVQSVELLRRRGQEPARSRLDFEEAGRPTLEKAMVALALVQLVHGQVQGRGVRATAAIRVLQGRGRRELHGFQARR